MPGRRVGQLHAADRHRQPHAQRLQPAQQRQVDALLQVHVEVVARVFDDVDHFVVERAGAKSLEMRAVEAQLRFGLDDVAHRLCQGLRLRGRGVLRHAKAKHDAALAHVAIVVDGLLEQLGVAHHHLFPAQGADARGLHAHLLHGACDGAHDDEVAHLEGLVHRDRHGGE